MSSTSYKVKLLTSAFGVGISSRDGEDIAFCCPSCSKSGSSKKKLAIKLDKGLYHCWVCGLSGKRIDSLFRKFAPHLLPELKKVGGWARSYKKDDETEEQPEIKLKIPDGFVLLGASLNSRDPDVKESISYCHRRGLSTRDIWYFKLGTCKSGRFRRRVIFPSFSDTGTLNYYTARSIDLDSKMKYINAGVPKKAVLFNDINIDWSQSLTLVEGPFDLTKSTFNSSCLLGSHLPDDGMLFRKIVKNRTPVNLALDPDAIQKSHNIAKLLSSYNIDVDMVTVPRGKDVGDLTRKAFQALVEKKEPWKSDDRLRILISKIKTGSII
jgi:hypothetical protein